jgi:DNA mismatch repair protein MutS
MALVKEYFKLCNKYKNEYGENTILLMQVGSFYECYGIKSSISLEITRSKIMDFSHICELNVVNKNTCVGEEDVVMAGFKVEFLEKYLRKIQEAGYTCVVYKQDEAAKNTTRSLEGIYSPGTYFSNESTKLTNNLTCIWIELINNKFTKGKVVIVGISNVDIFTGKTNIFEYKENYLRNPTTFDELERFISIYNPSEVIFISNLSLAENDDIINYVNITTNSIHIINAVSENENENENDSSERNKKVKNCEKQTYQKEILNKFFKITDFEVFYQNFYNNPIATQSFCYLLDFVYQHNPHLLNKISEPFFDNCSDRLVLANHSLKQLNIIDDNNYTGKYSSVLKMLNGCLTPMGKRKFANNFLNPTTNTKYLQGEYDIIEYMLCEDNYNKYNSFLKEKLYQIKDLSKWEREIFIKKISPNVFYNLHKNIKTISEIFEFIKDDSVIVRYLQNRKTMNTQYNTQNNIQTSCKNICNYIETNLNLNLAKECDTEDNFYINFFNFGIDETLDEKTEIIKASEKQLEYIRIYLNNLVKNKEKTTKSKTNATEYVNIHKTEKNNYSLIATNRRCKLLDDCLSKHDITVRLEEDITETETASKGIDFKISKKSFEYTKQSATYCFINHEQITSICKTITNTKIMMKDLISLTFNKFVETFGEKFQIHLECIIDFITIIDILYAKSSISKKYNYCKPTIMTGDKSFLDAKNLRHCLIEHLQINEYYITNDVLLGNNEIDGILLYGTNAVGKTSLIRAIGITVIMAQSGLYVPCSKFNYIPYKYIFTRILGNDNMFKSLSTFAVEMSELRTILRCANENSLILGDELCSGTEISSAISIFVAGIQKLEQCKSSYIFATHLHEIVDYGEITCINNLKIKHMSVIYDKENDCLVYDRKLKDGPGSCMYGLEVCKSLNLPMDFMENAYNIRMKYNKESGSILSLKESHFNSKKLMGLCENCGINMGEEVHHLLHQSEADDNGYINNNGYKIHKNNPANLLTLCERCHDEFHKNDSTSNISVLSELSDLSNISGKIKKQHRKVKTTKGMKLQEIFNGVKC